MEKFSTNDIVRYKGRLYTIEMANVQYINHEIVEANYSIVPLNISGKADQDDSLETAEEYFKSTIHDVSGNELSLVQRASR